MNSNFDLKKTVPHTHTHAKDKHTHTYTYKCNKPQVERRVYRKEQKVCLNMCKEDVNKSKKAGTHFERNRGDRQTDRQGDVVRI